MQSTGEIEYVCMEALACIDGRFVAESLIRSCLLGKINPDWKKHNVGGAVWETFAPVPHNYQIKLFYVFIFYE